MKYQKELAVPGFVKQILHLMLEIEN